LFTFVCPFLSLSLSLSLFIFLYVYNFLTRFVPVLLFVSNCYYLTDCGSNFKFLFHQFVSGVFQTSIFLSLCFICCLSKSSVCPYFLFVHRFFVGYFFILLTTTYLQTKHLKKLRIFLVYYFSSL
jgi:hypothetical protein